MVRPRQTREPLLCRAAARCSADHRAATPLPSEETLQSEGRSCVSKFFANLTAAAAIFLYLGAVRSLQPRIRPRRRVAPLRSQGAGRCSAICNQDQASTLGGPPVDRSRCPRPAGPPSPRRACPMGIRISAGSGTGLAEAAEKALLQPWAAKRCGASCEGRRGKISKRVACRAALRGRRPITLRSSPRPDWC